MTDRYSIETAYAFFHQKLRVYEHSRMDWQRDDIEQAIAGYVAQMSPGLLAELSQGRRDYLRDHSRFGLDLREAVEKLEGMLF